MDEKKVLLGKAKEAMGNAYAPYSNYHLGACVALTDGTYIPGANIENAAYGSCMCGERNAVYGAYSRGYRKEQIQALAIVSDGKKLVTPCGACRQVLAELLNPDTPIYLESLEEGMDTTIRELLPFAFDTESLEKE